MKFLLCRTATIQTIGCFDDNETDRRLSGLSIQFHNAKYKASPGTQLTPLALLQVRLTAR